MFSSSPRQSRESKIDAAQEAPAAASLSATDNAKLITTATTENCSSPIAFSRAIVVERIDEDSIEPVFSFLLPNKVTCDFSEIAFEFITQQNIAGTIPKKIISAKSDLLAAALPAYANLESGERLFAVPNLGGGITLVVLNQTLDFVILGFKRDGQLFKQYGGNLAIAQDVQDIPWIDLPHLKILYDTASNDQRSSILSLIEYGSNFLMNSPSLMVLVQDDIRSDTHLYDVGTLKSPVDEYLFEGTPSRQTLFSAMLHTFFKHGSRIAKELNLNPQDIDMGHSLALPCVTSIMEARAACRHFREIWREFNLEHSHGSVDPFLYASLIPIRFWTDDTLVRVSANTFIEHSIAFVDSGLSDREREDAAAFQLLATSAHLRYFSVHGKEHFRPRSSPETSVFDYVDIEVLIRDCEQVFTAIVNEPRSNEAINSDENSVSRREFFLFSLASSLDPAIFFDAQSSRLSLLRRLKTRCGASAFKVVLRDILDEEWKFADVSPWLADNVFLERVAGPLSAILKSDCTITTWTKPSSDYVGDPRLFYLTSSTRGSLQGPFFVQTPEGIRRSIPAIDRRRDFHGALLQALSEE